MASARHSRQPLRPPLADAAGLWRRLFRRTPPLAKRRFIPHRLGVEGFFRALQDRQINYAVLRWFETLPTVAPGEDVDMLIDDADVAAVADLFDPSEGAPCDLYSVTARPGTSHHGVPYLPPAGARVLLDRAIVLHGLFRVPSAQDHLLSLAFHAVYHKGLKSGLRTLNPQLEPTSTPEHDYAGELGRLAGELGLAVPIALEPLQQHLVAHGWAPTDAMLDMLVGRNPWLAAHMHQGDPRA
jgi:hypothetical protein